MQCPHCHKGISFGEGILEKMIKEIVFDEVHKHEVDTARSVHPVELEGLRKILKDNGQIAMDTDC